MAGKTKLWILLAACLQIFSGAACSVSSQSEQEVEVSFKARCLNVAEKYVKETRNWRKSDFEVQPQQAELGGIGFSIFYLPDKNLRSISQRGKSFHLELDNGCNKVIGELAYQ